ncbi:MAG: peptide-N-glycosidase F-related protein [Myxococcota bacterium]|nr:peptide-N-glycosidase F-related protein [Myxococcota bacterium]
MRRLVALLCLSFLTACPGEGPPPDEEPTPAPLTGQPWSEGPYGLEVLDTIESFSVPTREGEWTLRDEWTGEDSYVVLQLADSSGYTRKLWDSALSDLVAESSPDAHYFFVSAMSSWEDDADAMEAKIDDLLSELDEDEASHWQGRLHVIRSSVDDLGDPLERVLETWPDTWSSDIAGFAIDRFQRLRQLGLLRWPGGDSDPELKYPAMLTPFFDFEWDREQELAAQNATVVTIVQSGSNGRHSVELPPTEELLGYDRLWIDYGMECTGRNDANCPDWDTTTSLAVCTVEDPESCPNEIGRWISTYKREGRWIVDATSALAHLQQGGQRSFNVSGPGGNQYTVRLRFANSGEDGGRPSEVVPLWTGGAFNENYNAERDPITFDLPEDVVKVEVFAIISGHGWGVEEANCAEFCNHVHHWSVGEQEWVKDHLDDLGSFGCLSKIDRGVVPNQYGTWPLGRAGWCPGWEVIPFVADITDALSPGENTMDYWALYGNQEYVPQPATFPNNSGFPAQIIMNSWLVYWR